MPYRQRQKSHKLWFEIIQWFSEVSLQILMKKFQAYINSSVRRADYVTTTSFTLKIFRMACKS